MSIWVLEFVRTYVLLGVVDGLNMSEMRGEQKMKSEVSKKVMSDSIRDRSMTWQKEEGSCSKVGGGGGC